MHKKWKEKRLSLSVDNTIVPEQENKMKQKQTNVNSFICVFNKKV